MNAGGQTAPGSAPLDFDDMFPLWQTPWWYEPQWLVILSFAGLTLMIVLAWLYRRWRAEKNKGRGLESELAFWLADDVVKLAPQQFYERAVATMRQALGAWGALVGEDVSSACTEAEMSSLLAAAPLQAEQRVALNGLIERATRAKYAGHEIGVAELQQDRDVIIEMLRLLARQQVEVKGSKEKSRPD